jgi:hypothetical protein
MSEQLYRDDFLVA